MNQSTGYQTTADAVIAASGSLSAAVQVPDLGLVRVAMPSVWDAASMTFRVSEDGITYRDLYNADGTEYTLTVAASQAIIVPPADFASVRFLKVRSGTAGSPVSQTAAATITLVVRPV